MRFMIFVKATADSEAGAPPSIEMLTAMGKYNEELVAAGIMKDGDGLRPTKDAKRVHFSGNKRTVIDGPFAETKEVVAGYWIWECASIDEAVEWVKKCPNPMLTDSDIDIRPYYSAEDFATMTDELRAKEDKLRTKLDR
jgi:hypothetical protein